MKTLLLLFVIGIIAVAAPTAVHAAYTTYTGTALPDPQIWIPDDKYAGSETWTRIDTDTYPGGDGYNGDVPSVPVTYDTPVLRMGAPNGWNGFMTTLGADPEVSLGSRFRVKYTNNTIDCGPAILSLFTKGGSGLSLSVADIEYPVNPDRYWYTVNQFHVDSTIKRLAPIQTLPLRSPVELNEHGDPITYQTDWQYHEAWLYTNSTYGVAAAYFDGQEVWRGTLTDLLMEVDGIAEFGAASVVQHSAGSTDNRIFFDWVTVAQGASGPVVAHPVVTTISDVKTAANGTPVEINDALVTSVFYNLDENLMPYAASFAIQVADGSMGVRVINPDSYSYVSPGDIVDIIGGTDTVNGERVIKAMSFIGGDTSDVPRPIALNNRATAGGQSGAQQAVCDDVNAVPAKMSTGANNIGLLTTIFGKVTKVEFAEDFEYDFTDYFYIDDGSGLNDGSGYTGIKCRAPSKDFFDWVEYTLPSEGQYVSVTGVMGTTESNGKIVRYFWTWSWEAL